MQTQRVTRPKIAKTSLELVGNTPLVQLNKVSENCCARVVAKLESFNPLSCVKERIAKSMIEAAEIKGDLKPGGTIIEPTSGNTGIGLAFVAAVKGYKLILTMPDTMSIERRKLISALGAEIVLTPGDQGMKGAITKAEIMQQENPGSIILQQFQNPANPAIHEKTTAIEIWEDTDGAVDIFVAGVGTGGTITGVSTALKKLKPELLSIAVEPTESAVLSGGTPGKHKIMGIGAGFIPEVYQTNIVDEVITVSSEQAGAMARRLAKEEGIFVGISSGAAVAAAVEIAQRPELQDKLLVVLLPDTGERYLSTWLYNED